MKKRVTLHCWNCERDYTLQRQLDNSEHILNVACPYCGQEGVVNLKPWLAPSTELYQSEDGRTQSIGQILNLPDVLPTSKE